MKFKSLVILIMICSIYVNAQISLPYSQDFEASTFPPSGWQTFPIGSPLNWEWDTTASSYGIGSACISFDNYTTAAGSYYGIRLPPMLFDVVTNPYIRFDVAYAQRTGAASDILGIWWSNNGSSNWQSIINYSGINLSTAPSTANIFVPTAGQWQTKTLSLSFLAGLPYVRLAIEDNCNNGNKIYLDNVVVFDSITTISVDEVDNSKKVVLYPNPGNDQLNILKNSSEHVQFTLFNSLGNTICEKTLFGRNTSIDISTYSKGIYFYELSSEIELLKKGKLIKQ
jgi:hypothetical protein